MAEAQARPPGFKQALLGGALAGTAVDAALFPLDTIKTRLQSRAGFLASGGFKGVYSGLLSAVVGSAPNAALFFVTYEFTKRVLKGFTTQDHLQPFIHMAAASVGEVSACTVRVPTEVIKQRMQTGQYPTTSQAVRSVLRSEGLLGFYRGYLTTVAREIPFTCIQFPIYEYCKKLYTQIYNEPIHPMQAALCGSLAGGLAAAATTPLDVVKTRIMLSSKHNTHAPYVGTIESLRRIAREEGPRTLWKGVGPRVMWISIGGSIFLGVYEWGVRLFEPTI